MEFTDSINSGCTALLKEEVKHASHIIKMDSISYPLLKDKQIKLLEGHKIPSVKELKGKKYYKEHTWWSHSTNGCLVFQNVIWKFIMEGRLKFSNKNKGVTLIDGDLFPKMVVNIKNVDLVNIVRYVSRSQSG